MPTRKKIRVVHYINQFFAGIGGEDKADHGLEFKDGPIGPGILLQKMLGDEGEIVGTVFCGDNTFSAQGTGITDEAVEQINRFSPDLLIAGPAFNAGRYGIACAKICLAVEAEGKIPVLTAMFPENPGVSICQRHIRVVPTSNTAADMADALSRVVPLGIKIARGTRVGSASDEGYLPRGVRYNEIAEVPSGRRAVDMVLKKIRGEPFVTELVLKEYDKVTPPPPVEDLKSTKIAIVTESGLVPPGNPDRIAGARATNWNHYSIEGKDELPEGSFIFIHGGYNTVFVNQDPDRMVGLDALRSLEEEGVFGGLHNEILSTCGNGGSLLVMQKIGQEMAEEVKKAGATGVILPAT